MVSFGSVSTDNLIRIRCHIWLTAKFIPESCMLTVLCWAIPEIRGTRRRKFANNLVFKNLGIKKKMKFYELCKKFGIPIFSSQNSCIWGNFPKSHKNFCFFFFFFFEFPMSSLPLWLKSFFLGGGVGGVRIWSS